jgi:ribosomal protein S18 acetylase RimI-like enzyme
MQIELATTVDRLLLADMAGSVFLHGRFHQDPKLGAAIGNVRYKAWLLNAFELDHQYVYKFKIENSIIAFFVVEYPDNTSAFWSLTALAPGMQGKGLGRRVWNSMMLMHKKKGVNSIATSISSHNTAVINLYISLKFKFPLPLVTYHWQK